MERAPSTNTRRRRRTTKCDRQTQGSPLNESCFGEKLIWEGAGFDFNYTRLLQKVLPGKAADCSIRKAESLLSGVKPFVVTRYGLDQTQKWPNTQWGSPPMYRMAKQRDRSGLTD